MNKNSSTGLKMKKILALMMEAGSGHKMPAMAVKNSIHKMDKSIDFQVIDGAKEVGCLKFDNFYKDSWNFCLNNPKLFSTVYPILNSGVAHQVEKFLRRDLKKKILNYITQTKPDLIFTTHFTFNQIVGDLKKENKLDVPTVSFITDAFDPHRNWINKNNDYTIIYSKDANKKLTKKGLTGSQIKNFNFPLREVFQSKKVNVNGTRSKLGLEKNKFTVTLVSGGEGIGDLDKIILPFIESDLDVQMVVVCGRNEALKNKLENLAKTHNTKKFSLTVLGFVTNMEEYVSASDLMMGKSGLSFMFESFIYKKPIIITQCLKNEEPALKAFLKEKVCWYRKKPKQAYELVTKILKDKGGYNDYVKNIENLSIDNGSDEIAQFLLNLLNKNEV